MNKMIPALLAAAVSFGASAAVAATATVTIDAIDASGIGAKIGTVRFSDTKAGLKITPHLTHLPAGTHGMHVHANPSCAPAAGPDGKMAAGVAAGGHSDPMKTGKHMGPMSTEGHQGDLPALVVDAKGNATASTLAPHLKLADVKGHAIMIHAGGDNYSDQPLPLGGGGGRIACGVLK